LLIFASFSYSLRSKSKQIKANLTLLFASKRINIRFEIRLYSLRSEYRGHPSKNGIVRTGELEEDRQEQNRPKDDRQNRTDRIGQAQDDRCHRTLSIGKISPKKFKARSGLYSNIGQFIQAKNIIKISLDCPFIMAIRRQLLLNMCRPVKT
jgi:hypothetical protein